MKAFIVLLNIISLSVSLAQSPLNFSPSFVSQAEQKVESHSSGGSKAKYILYSLIIPGAGQWGLGEKNRAKFFFGAEALLWMGYFGTNAYADVIQKNYQAYSAVHAGTSQYDKSEQYWIDIGSADNLYDFNEQQLRNRNLKAVYPESELYYWQWDSKDNQSYYNNLRVQEHDWERRATFIVGAFILNRIVSVIDVIRLIHKENKPSSEQSSSLSLLYHTNRYNEERVQLNLRISW
ncbi:MAG: hypothetical protein A2Y94_09890 [Caldithrix sp. RBG_13_44_9]|nr:MAG: hypothetical protein A2Y94_09890 [Caldithrix sp. RBG_13_44_9]